MVANRSTDMGMMPVADARIGHLDPPAGVWKHGTSAAPAMPGSAQRDDATSTPRRPGRGRFGISTTRSASSRPGLPAAGRRRRGWRGRAGARARCRVPRCRSRCWRSRRRRLGGGQLEPGLGCGGTGSAGCPPGSCLTGVGVRPRRGGVRLRAWTCVEPAWSGLVPVGVSTCGQAWSTEGVRAQ